MTAAAQRASATVIQQAWLGCYDDPSRSVCKRRLQRLFEPDAKRARLQTWTGRKAQALEGTKPMAALQSPCAGLQVGQHCPRRPTVQSFFDGCIWCQGDERRHSCAPGE
ncbi:hypothetical protein WJX84_012456 [Apatococcus fuscideae]|uniref:Uncharacterized protein n=1 Tax=Apatococcus fuscideae TaxID=2026836 RepID=A0AAW1TG66_9CHLO